MAGITEDFRTLYCDPGEDFGWCLGRGTTLLAAGTEKMWTFADEVWDSVFDHSISYLCQPDVGGLIRPEAAEAEASHPPAQNRVGRIVCENFRIYPWAARQLAWNEVRTARVIGALTMICRRADPAIQFITQPAAIKAAAQAAGAEELYYHPLHENRHQNDAIQHYVYFTCTELLGLKLPVPAQNEDKR